MRDCTAKRTGAWLGLFAVVLCFAISIVSFRDNLDHMARETHIEHSILSAVAMMPEEGDHGLQTDHGSGKLHHAHPNICANLLTAAGPFETLRLGLGAALELSWALDHAVESGPAVALERPPKPIALS